MVVAVGYKKWITKTTKTMKKYFIVLADDYGISNYQTEFTPIGIIEEADEKSVRAVLAQYISTEKTASLITHLSSLISHHSSLITHLSSLISHYPSLIVQLTKLSARDKENVQTERQYSAAFHRVF